MKKNRPLRCKEHKKNDMISVIHPTCQYNGCKKRAHYGYTELLFCSVHKQDNMNDLNHSKCINCNIIRANPKYKKYCFKCYCSKFPNEEIPRRYKLKETELHREIIKFFPEEKIQYNKIISGGCSKRRPDELIDKLTHCIVIEYDEEQHKGISCEDKRIMEISRDLNHRPTIFIRFNPDKYITKEGKKKSSCFYFSSDNRLKIYKNIFKIRIDKLVETIQYYLDNIPEKTITIEQLFYDGYD